MNHTPGPWAFESFPGEKPGIATVGFVAGLCIGPDYGTPEMADFSNHGDHVADAALCAAAPDLLAACIALLSESSECGCGACRVDTHWKASAAVDKATS